MTKEEMLNRVREAKGCKPISAEDIVREYVATLDPNMTLAEVDERVRVFRANYSRLYG